MTCLKSTGLMLAMALAGAAGAAGAQPPGEAPGASPLRVDEPDLGALVECRADFDRFQALAPLLQDPLRAVAMGWRPLPQANLFMTEFVLPAPISVFGHSSAHIAFAGDTLLAVLDLADPRSLARELELETAIDTPTKLMAGREARSIDRVDPDNGQALVESQVLAVSTVDSHPGQSLVGCSYSLDLAEEMDGELDAGPEDPPPGLRTGVDTPLP